MIEGVGNCSARMRQCLKAMAVLLCCHGPLAYAVCKNEASNAEKTARRIEGEWPLRPAQDRETRHVQQIADYLVLVVELRMDRNRFDWPQSRWTFRLVRDLSVNAYSIGNGGVYLTDGTFDFVRDEAELAAIIAHEIAHQLAGHFCGSSQGRDSYRVGSLVQVMDNAKEMKADSLAVEIMQHTYYPPEAMLEVVKRLPTMMDGSVQKRLRIKALESLLQGVKSPPFKSSPEFLQIKQNGAGF